MSYQYEWDCDDDDDDDDGSFDPVEEDEWPTTLDIFGGEDIDEANESALDYILKLSEN